MISSQEMDCHVTVNKSFAKQKSPYHSSQDGRLEPDKQTVKTHSGVSEEGENFPTTTHLRAKGIHVGNMEGPLDTFTKIYENYSPKLITFAGYKEQQQMKPSTSTIILSHHSPTKGDVQPMFIEQRLGTEQLTSPKITHLTHNTKQSFRTFKGTVETDRKTSAERKKSGN